MRRDAGDASTSLGSVEKDAPKCEQYITVAARGEVEVLGEAKWQAIGTDAPPSTIATEARLSELDVEVKGFHILFPYRTNEIWLTFISVISLSKFVSKFYFAIRQLL